MIKFILTREFISPLQFSQGGKQEEGWLLNLASTQRPRQIIKERFTITRIKWYTPLQHFVRQKHKFCNAFVTLFLTDRQQQQYECHIRIQRGHLQVSVGLGGLGDPPRGLFRGRVAVAHKKPEGNKGTSISSWLHFGKKRTVFNKTSRSCSDLMLFGRKIVVWP